MLGTIADHPQLEVGNLASCPCKGADSKVEALPVSAPSKRPRATARPGQPASGDEVITVVSRQAVTRLAGGRTSRTRAVRAPFSRPARTDIERRNAVGVVAAVPAFHTNGISSRPMSDGSHAEPSAARSKRHCGRPRMRVSKTPIVPATSAPQTRSAGEAAGLNSVGLGAATAESYRAGGLRCKW